MITKSRVSWIDAKDQNGTIVFAQFPNLPIITWFVCTMLHRVISDGSLSSALSFVGTGALFTWAWLELFDGVTYFRRLLGLVVLLWLVNAHI